MEFETDVKITGFTKGNGIRIYSVGVWNKADLAVEKLATKLEFTPLEFETMSSPEREKHLAN